MFEWQLVASPTFFPGYCIDGSQGGPNEGVIDTSIEFDGRRVYLPVRPVKQAARDLLGMVEAAALAQTEAKLAAAEARVTALEIELADAAPILAAIAGASAKFGGVSEDDEPVRGVGEAEAADTAEGGLMARLAIRVAGGTNAGCRTPPTELPKQDWTCPQGHLNRRYWARCLTPGCNVKRSNG